MKKNRLKDFTYDLPKNLIAQAPIKPRDHSRLLVLDKETGKIDHKHFYNLPDYLKPGDVLVLNNTKVMPARLIGNKAETGGKIEVFLLKKAVSPPDKGEVEGVSLKRDATPLIPPLSGGRSEIWQCLIGGKKKREGLKIEFAGGLKAELLKNNQDSTWQVKFNKSGAGFMKLISKIGRAPLPPYINSTSSEQARKKQYQTVYADEKKLGSVAAPTAGFHFTEKLIKQLKKKGVQFEFVTLQVGLGTFAPVKVLDITKHRMHAEWIEVKASAIKRIQKAKLEGRRVIAVGTTSARTLEALAKFSIFNFQFSNNFRIDKFSNKTKNQNSLRVANCGLRDYSGWTDIFIYPGYKFKAVDAIITNFHLPKSTLIMLISAFAGTSASPSTGREKIIRTYEEAIKKKYRFYSYGDAMLII